MFCKNEWSKRSNNNEKGGQQDRKSRRKLAQIASKVSNDNLLWKNRLTLGQIISGTKCDRDKLIFFMQKEGVNKIELSIKGTQWNRKMSKHFFPPHCRNVVPSWSTHLLSPIKVNTDAIKILGWESKQFWMGIMATLSRYAPDLPGFLNHDRSQHQSPSSM